MPIFNKNIGIPGRVARAVAATALGIAALLAWPQSLAIGIALAASSAFVLFEAARGWCVARACGMKTKF